MKKIIETFYLNLLPLFVHQTWPTTILVVSHDRSFLDAVATDILHIHSQRIDSYRGNYEVFHKTRDEKLKNQQREYEAQKQYRDHIQVSGENIGNKSQPSANNVCPSLSNWDAFC